MITTFITAQHNTHTDIHTDTYSDTHTHIHIQTRTLLFIYTHKTAPTLTPIHVNPFNNVLPSQKPSHEMSPDIVCFVSWTIGNNALAIALRYTTAQLQCQQLHCNCTAPHCSTQPSAPSKRHRTAAPAAHSRTTTRPLTHHGCGYKTPTSDRLPHPHTSSPPLPTPTPGK